MRSTVRGVTRASALLLIAALAATGCGRGGGNSSNGATAGDTTGLTSTTIKVGGTFPLTGVAAPGYSEIPLGIKAYFDYVNAAGGVNGRTIQWTAKDDGYNPTTTSQVTNQLVLQDKVFAMLGDLGTPTHEAVVDFLNQNKVPDMFVSSGSVLWGDKPGKYPWTFGWQTDYESEGKIIGQWIDKNMPTAKVAMFIQNDDFGTSGLKGVQQYANKQIVTVQKYTPGGTDVSPQLAAIKASGADVVVGFVVPSYTALAELTALKLNYKPQWIFSNVGSDPTLVGSLLASFSKGQVKNGSSLLDGVITTQYIPGVDDPSNPWIQLFTKVWNAHGNGQPLTNYEVYGMSEAYTFVQALQLAGKNLTREGLVKALERGGSHLEGPWFAPMRYSDSSHLGISGMKVVKIENGKAVPVTPLEVTDVGNVPITPGTPAAATPPANGIPDVKPVM